MTISKRNYQIYKLATAENAPTQEEIGRTFGMTKQRVSAIVQQVNRQLGITAKPIVSKYPVKLNNFYVTEEQARSIIEVPGDNRSDKLREIIDFYAVSGEFVLGIAEVDRKYPKLIGGLYVSEEQKKTIDSVPFKSYAARMRYLINFYITYC